MKKLLKFFAVPAILALGLLTGCSNDVDPIDLNVTVSTDKPQLDNPKNLGYGVLLTWRQVKDNGSFKVTRKAARKKCLHITLLTTATLTL